MSSPSQENANPHSLPQLPMWWVAILLVIVVLAAIAGLVGFGMYQVHHVQRQVERARMEAELARQQEMVARDDAEHARQQAEQALQQAREQLQAETALKTPGAIDATPPVSSTPEP